MIRIKFVKRERRDMCWREVLTGRNIVDKRKVDRHKDRYIEG